MKSHFSRKARFGSFGSWSFAVVLGGLLAGCSDDPNGSVMRAYRPLSSDMMALMQEKGTTQNAPVLIRTYKKEAEFEIWKLAADGHYVLFKTYPMCRWSGQLGPKTREGDRQVPEGFYSIAPGQMNPHSSYYLSFNVGYPNAYDRAHGYGGGSIMVHGVCSSAGCYSMTNEQMGEIYALAREAFLGGQRAIQMQSFPFHLTAENFAKYRLDPNIAFWKELKVGADNFEVTKQDVAVGVCGSHYVFNVKAADGAHLDPNAPCPALKPDDAIRAEVVAKERRDDAKVAELVAQGVKPVHTVYADGGQNPSFAKRYFPDVSRPDALAQGPVDIPMDDGKAKKFSPVAQMAANKDKAKDKTKDLKQVAAQQDQTGMTEPQKPAEPEQAKNNSSFFGSIWGQNNLQAASPPVSIYEPATPQPANVPLPPPRLQTLAMRPTTDQQ